MESPGRRPPPAGKMGSAPFQENPEIPGGVPPPMEGQRPYQNGKKSGANVASDGIVLGQHGWLGGPRPLKVQARELGLRFCAFSKRRPKMSPCVCFGLPENLGIPKEKS